MWCVYHQPRPATLIRLLHPQPKQNQNGQYRRDQVLFFSPSIAYNQSQLITSSPSLRVKLRVKASIIPPSESGDITTFLEISGGLIFIYWIFNFVVPDLISKYFQFDKVNQEGDSDNKP